MKATEILTSCGTFTVQESVEEAKKAIKGKGQLTKLSGREWSIKGVEYNADEKIELTDEVKVYAYTSIELEAVSYEVKNS